jgi:hypothetical protein
MLPVVLEILINGDKSDERYTVLSSYLILDVSFWYVKISLLKRNLSAISADILHVKRRQHAIGSIMLIE